MLQTFVRSLNYLNKSGTFLYVLPAGVLRDVKSVVCLSPLCAFSQSITLFFFFNMAELKTRFSYILKGENFNMKAIAYK